MANYFGGWYFFLNSVKSYECQIMELSMTSVYVCGSLNDTMQHGYISFKNLAAWKCWHWHSTLKNRLKSKKRQKSFYEANTTMKWKEKFSPNLAHISHIYLKGFISLGLGEPICSMIATFLHYFCLRLFHYLRTV